jgi:diaminopimelate epimerase
MQINFSKYHGAGNDFIIVDNRNNLFPKNTNVIKQLCNRNFGIGADGLMLLESSSDSDFYMRYYNSDGKESTMCGNGGRCITLFAKQIGLIDIQTNFTGIDGGHIAQVVSTNIINLKMNDVNGIEIGDNYYFMNTGSPHFVRFVNDLQNIDIAAQGRLIRNNFNLQNGGTNVNFADISNGVLQIRTYERGVESETLACGTGSVASAIAYYLHTKSYQEEYEVHTQGGVLQVRFTNTNDKHFKNIWLKGPAIHVFDGHINL